MALRMISDKQFTQLLSGLNDTKEHTEMICIHCCYNALAPESKFKIYLRYGIRYQRQKKKIYIPFEWVMHVNN